MRLIVVPLVVMMFCSVLYQSMAMTGTAFFVDSSVANQSDLGGTLTEGESSTDVSVEGYDLEIGFDPVTGAIALLITTVAVAVVVGFQVAGSGLNEFSVGLIVKVAFFYGLWALLSLFGINGLTIIPLFGWLLYLLLTVVFSLGVLEQVG